jgi:tetratricopeptide (TPR) repeat protein
MFVLGGSKWGPSPLPDFLRSQLDAHGFGPNDAGRCARLINEHPGGAAASSLFVDLGSCKFLEADIDGAIASWRHAIASQHDAAASRSLLNLGLLYEHLHLHEQAIGLLSRVAERNIEPYVFPAAMASARCQVEMGDAERAMETMARPAQFAMARRPDGPEVIEALYGFGEVADHAGRPDRAERAWRVVALSPSSPIQQEATDRLIQLLVDQGRSHAALDAVNTGLMNTGLAGAAMSPSLLDTVELLLQTGEKNAAIELLATAESADFEPTDQFRLVDANLAAGRVNDAIDDLEALLADSDEQVQHRTLFTLGRVYASYDMIDPAVSMFQRAVASDDPYWMPAASLALGDVLAARGDLNPASEYWSYAASGAVSRIAEQARERLATPSPEAAEHAPVDPESVELVEPAVESEIEPTDAVEPELVTAVDPAAASASNAAAAPTPSPATEPQFISLDSIEAAAPSSNNREQPLDSAENDPVAAVPADSSDVALDIVEPALTEPLALELPQPSAFANHLSEHDRVEAANPYAVLAPDRHHSDVAPTTRNPYAELAPSYDGDFEPPPNVEPGDWESISDDWPRDEPRAKPNKGSSAFSRYT